MKELTHDYLKSILEYNPETGVFTWLPRKNNPEWNAMFAGRRTGHNQRGHYRRVRISKQKYAEHRLAWFYVHGVWPTHCIDHIDNNPRNNAISNLRDIPAKLNLARQTSKNPFGKGVCRSGKKFMALITKNKITHYLGSFKTPEEARAAYCKKAEELWGEFAK